MPSVGVFGALFDEQGRILLVQRNYGPRNWTTPGGRMDPGEDPSASLAREVLEETGYRITVGAIIGIYSAPFKDDLVLFFLAEQLGRDSWQPGDEIADLRFFGRDELPPMRERTLVRVLDAFDRRTGVFRIFDLDDVD